jgi:hypothetical protein
VPSNYSKPTFCTLRAFGFNPAAARTFALCELGGTRTCAIPKSNGRAAMQRIKGSDGRAQVRLARCFSSS